MNDIIPMGAMRSDDEPLNDSDFDLLSLNSGEFDGDPVPESDGDDWLKVLLWVIAGVFVLSLCLFATRTKERIVYVDGTNAVEVTHRYTEIWGFERRDIESNRLETTWRDIKAVELRGFDDDE